MARDPRWIAHRFGETLTVCVLGASVYLLTIAVYQFKSRTARNRANAGGRVRL